MRVLPLLFCLLATATTAQEQPARLALELNAAKTSENTCTLTFLIQNDLGQDLTKSVFETVLFDTQGQVNRLTLFDFGALPSARQRARQFVVPQTTCEGLGRILINGATECQGGTLSPADCERGLIPTSKTAIQVTG